MKRLFACALIAMLLTTLLFSCDLWNKNDRVDALNAVEKNYQEKTDK